MGYPVGTPGVPRGERKKEIESTGGLACESSTIEVRGKVSIPRLEVGRSRSESSYWRLQERAVGHLAFSTVVLKWAMGAE